MHLKAEVQQRACNMKIQREWIDIARLQGYKYKNTKNKNTKKAF